MFFVQSKTNVTICVRINLLLSNPINLEKSKILLFGRLLTFFLTTDFERLKEFADNNVKFDENGRKLCNRVENTAEKGEIAHFEHF